MAWICDEILDAALQYIETNTENLYITNAEATTFLEASATFLLGTKAGPTFTGPGPGDVSGRKITVDAIADGAVTVTDTATHWALTDDTSSLLMVTGSLAAPQVVTNGNVFTLAAFDIEFPDPA